MDIFEFNGNPLEDVIFGSYHWGQTCGKDKFPIPGKGFRPHGSSADWQMDSHVYAMEWTEERMDYYVDDALYFTRSGDAFELPQAAMYLIVNQAVGVVPTAGGIYPEAGVALAVEYVRVYEKQK